MPARTMKVSEYSASNVLPGTSATTFAFFFVDATILASPSPETGAQGGRGAAGGMPAALGRFSSLAVASYALPGSP
ncbi:MAG: hypothetical protein JST54_12650 [Deltaproteobacteria bacterium]|nr:hypothetical protein [Deltaproteobacteria bacterium]